MSSPTPILDFSLPISPLPERFQNYRLNEKFVDITIKVGRESFPAHRMVLEDSSPVLKVQLSSNWLKDDVCELSEEFIAPEIVEDLLTYFYLSKIQITPENAHALCIASHYLNIPTLLSVTENYLSERISCSDVLDLYMFSNRVELESLHKKCLDYVFRNFETVFQDTKIQSFSEENLKKLMKELNDHGNSSSMKKSFFELIVFWVKFDSLERSSILPSLLKCIPLDTLPHQYLSEIVANEKLISESFPCSKVLIEAFSKISLSSTSSLLSPSVDQQTDKLICFVRCRETITRRTNDGTMSETINTGAQLNQLRPPYKQFEEVGQKLNIKRRYIGIAASKTKVYFCGGLLSNSRSFEVSDTFQAYDLVSHRITQLQQIPSPRYDCGVAILGDFVYISGGEEGDYDNRINMSTVLKYNISTECWQYVKSMKHISGWNKLLTINRKLYAIGRSNSQKSVLFIEEYDPDSAPTGEWSQIGELTIPNSYETYPFAAITLNDELYIHYRDNSNELMFKAYSPLSRTWRTLPALNALQKESLVVMNNKIWALTMVLQLGVWIEGLGNARYKSFEFDPKTEEWSPLGLTGIDAAAWEDSMFSISYPQ